MISTTKTFVERCVLICSRIGTAVWLIILDLSAVTGAVLVLLALMYCVAAAI